MKNFPGKQHAGEVLSELPKASTSSARRFSGRYAWTIVFSLSQFKQLEKCAALHQQDSGQGQSNNFGKLSPVFNPLKRWGLLQPCLSPRSLDLISKPGAALITNSTKSRQMSNLKAQGKHGNSERKLHQIANKGRSHWLQETWSVHYELRMHRSALLHTSIVIWGVSYDPNNSFYKPEALETLTSSIRYSKLRPPEWHQWALNAPVNDCSSSCLSASPTPDKQSTCRSPVNNTLNWGLKHGPNSWCQLLW